MILQMWRLRPRNVTRSFATSSVNQRAEDHHRQLEAYGYFLPLQTRWEDIDRNNHVNNSVYFSFFDSILSRFLIRHCGLDPNPQTSSLTGFTVSNQCQYYKAISYPQIPVAALAVEKAGRSSVYYRLAVFPPKSTEEMPSVDHCDLIDGFFLGHPKLAQFDPLACATGSAVHVFVNPRTGKAENLPEDFRNKLQKLMRPT